MNREIKFRTWDKQKKEMILRAELEFMRHRSDEESAVMQWTGLKDRKGKDIYEGDIVKHHSTIPFSKNGRKGTKRVMGIWYIGWDNCRFKLIPVKKEYGRKHTLHPDPHLFEVIGNIYKNKELLK